jgi:hypothetical protein
MPNTRTSALNKLTPKLTPMQLHRKVAMLRLGVSAASIGRTISKSRQAVTMVLLDQMRSREIEEAVAGVLGEPVDQLFPALSKAS